MLKNLLLECWNILSVMSPYLLFGFLMAGIFSVFLSKRWVETHLGGKGIFPILKASCFGIPLPLCSCSVIPVSISIMKQGASRPATIAFLLSTPQTGIDSIFVNYALLGPAFTIFRPISALATGIFGGLLINFFEDKKEHRGIHPPSNHLCCSERKKYGALRKIFYYAFVSLPKDISIALLIGIFITACSSLFIPEKAFSTYIGGGFGGIFIVMLAAIPLYVCATASVPIAAGLIHMGASPGTALAFLMAGPASNAATFTTIWKFMGSRIAFLYFLTIFISAFLFGMTFDWLFPSVNSLFPQLIYHGHEKITWLHYLSAIIFLAIIVFSHTSSRKHKNRIRV